MLVDVNGSEIGVLFSGGLDSSILLARLLEEGHPVQPFYIRSGCVWEKAEYSAAQQFLGAVASPQLRPLVHFQMPVSELYSRHWSVTGIDTPGADSADEAVYLPGRNVLLLVKPALWCQLNGVGRLALAPLGTSPFADASLEFARRFEELVNWGAPHSVEVLLPFAERNKRDVMRLGSSYPLELTFSCIAPQAGLHCGRCNKCAERRTAFEVGEIPDRTRYAA